MIQVSTRNRLTSAVHRRALDAALALGERLLAVSGEHRDDDQWFPSRSLAGSPGFALAFMALWRATGEARFESAMHAFIRTAAGVDDRPDLGLYTGIGGLRGVVALACAYEPRYRGLLAKCDSYIDDRTPQLATRPASFNHYDVIGGWSGTQLARTVATPRPADGFVNAIAWVLEDDTRWSCVHPIRGGEPEHDLGLAHGVAGMLAALALTLDDASHYSATIRRAASDLASHAVERDGVLLWSHTRDTTDDRLRAAWCYGTPGIAAALNACALLLGDERLRELAVRAAESLDLAPSASYVIDEPNLCHGTIGNALCVASVAADSPTPGLQRLVERYVTEAIDQLESENWHCMARNDRGQRIDQYDELNGSAGIIVALLTLCGSFEPDWMHLHGLRPIH